MGFAAPSSFVVVVTPNLLTSCPIWHDIQFCPKTPCLERIYRLRERWSHREVTITAPSNPRLAAGDLHRSLQTLSYWQCRSLFLWQVTGPAELLADLDGDIHGEPAARP
ncbi:MAG: hypothetical protein WAN65_13640, partial [Candidatus Sulfotelmatobacter sp.]